MSVQIGFNLVDDPWLPVRYRDGRSDVVGLYRLYTDAPDIAELAIAFPLEYVATLRMLVTILQSACDGPTGTHDKVRWLEGHGELLPTVEAYLERWHERFELFHPERPFMQAPVGDDTRPTTVAALRIDWASGNNATLFDHHVDANPPALGPGEAVRAMLTTLLYQPGGGVSKPFNRTDSPATKTLQAVVDGRDLWETLVVNSPTLDDPAARPVWERAEHDAARVSRDGTTPEGWLDRASWRSRAIRLLADDDGLVRQVRLHQHLRLSDAPPFDPFAPMRREQDAAPAPVRASAGKALWRDAEALIVGLRATEEHPTVVSQALDAFDMLDEPWLPGLRIVGLVVNQAKVTDIREARMPITSRLLEDDLWVGTVAAIVGVAEDGARALRGAINTASVELGLADGWKRAGRWETGYWAQLAAPFSSRLDVLCRSDDPASLDAEVVAPWRSTVVAAARDGFDRFAADGAAGRAPRAVGRGRAALERRLRGIRPGKEG